MNIRSKITVISQLTLLLFSQQSLCQESDEKVSINENPQEKKASQIVTVFDDRGVLTTRGNFIVEPSYTYTHTSSTVVAVEGFTILPALIVGLINISQAQRDINNYSLALRYGLTSRMEISVKVPYIDIEESIRERQVLDGTPIDIVSDTSGNDLGDIEASINYQINNARGGFPFFIANLRIKSDTGNSIFDIDKRELTNDDGDVVGILFSEQPTGSGFWSVQPGISILYPTDPAVLYGSISYLYNIEDDKGTDNGGDIDPGDVIGLSFGIGFSVNERTSFSLGYQHDIIDQTTVELAPALGDATFDTYHSGSLLVGISQVLTQKSSLNVSVAVGVTEQSPDVQLTFKVPYAF
jgi:hypothetical protein